MLIRHLLPGECCRGSCEFCMAVCQAAQAFYGKQASFGVAHAVKQPVSPGFNTAGDTTFNTGFNQNSQVVLE